MVESKKSEVVGKTQVTKTARDPKTGLKKEVKSTPKKGGNR